jgi:hypothetical protein
MDRGQFNFANHGLFMTFRHSALLLLFPILLHSSESWGSTIVDPLLVMGSNAIDPHGAQQLDFLATGAVSPGILAARSDFYALQNFAGFTGKTSGTTNIVDFTSALLADIRFTVSASNSLDNSAGGNFVNQFGTSPESSIFLAGASQNSTVYYHIEFGHYDSFFSTFTPGVSGVDAAAFTLSGLWFGSPAQIVTADFYRRNGTLLATQTATAISSDPDEGGNRADAFFGYDVAGSATPASDIGSIRVTIDPGPNRGNSGVYFDDFGFTAATTEMAAVPEPGSFALVAGLLLMLAGAACARRGYGVGKR